VVGTPTLEDVRAPILAKARAPLPVA